MEFRFRPIGVIRSPHTRAEETPIQPQYAKGVRGRVEVLPEFQEGLSDIEGYSHICLIYVLDRADEAKLTVVPYVDDTPRGVFATRAPCRPNPIGVSVVRLLSRSGNVLEVEELDILDGTPLLDIKPYIERFGSHDSVRSGWQDEVDDATARRRGSRQRGRSSQGRADD